MRNWLHNHTNFVLISLKLFDSTHESHWCLYAIFLHNLQALYWSGFCNGINFISYLMLSADLT